MHEVTRNLSCRLKRSQLHSQAGRRAGICSKLSSQLTHLATDEVPGVVRVKQNRSRYTQRKWQRLGVTGMVGGRSGPHPFSYSCTALPCERVM